MPSSGISSARAAASRANGSRSRGPRTVAGKARSSRNALKHGLRAHKHVLLHDEDPAELAALETALVEDVAPEGALQGTLALRLASAAWRMTRADRLEADILDERGLRAQGAQVCPGLALIRDANGPRAFDTLLRYRGTVLAELLRSLRALKALQTEEAKARAAAAKAVPPDPEPAPVLVFPPKQTREAIASARPNEPEPRGNPALSPVVPTTSGTMAETDRGAGPPAEEERPIG